MEIKIALDLSQLIEIYAYANTPGYLYKHFKRNESISRLAKALPIEDLVKEYTLIVGRQNRSIEDVVAAYAILVLLAGRNLLRKLIYVDHRIAST